MWVSWMVKWNVDVNTYLPGMPRNDHGIKFIEKVSEGDGEGPQKPVFTPRVIIRKLNPAE